MKHYSWPSRMQTCIETKEEQLLTVAQKSINSGNELKSVKELVSQINQSKNERAQIAKTFSNQGLEYEAIIRKDFFFEMIKKIDTEKNLFYFSEIDSRGMVHAHTRALHESSILSTLDEYISIPEEDLLLLLDEKMLQNFTNIFTDIIHESKNLLWPNRQDIFSQRGIKRKIPIKILEAPQKIKRRLNFYAEKKLTVSWLLHRESFFLDTVFEEISYLDSWDKTVYDTRIFSAFNESQRQKLQMFRSTIKISLDYVHEIIETGRHDYVKVDDVMKTVWLNKEKLLQKLVTIFEKQFNNLYTNDPLAFVEYGQWVVIIDQYGKFPQEQALMKAICDHYQILSQKYLFHEN